MDFDTINGVNFAMYSNKSFENNPYIPQMDEGSSFTTGGAASSSSSSSNRFFTNNTLDYFPVEGSNFNALCNFPTFQDPFDPFQASFIRLNQDSSKNSYMHGSFQTAVDHHQCQTTHHFEEYYLQSKNFLEEDDDHNKGGINVGKNPNKRKRVVDTKSEIIKGQWTPEEDGMLVELVEKHGVRKWSTIAQLLRGRIGKQCRERWHNHLKPDIKKDRWSEEEDQALIEAHRKLGNRWAEIARSLPGRSENTIKNHWNATKRRQLSSRTNANSTSTPLQNYIRTIIVDAKAPSPAPTPAPAHDDTFCTHQIASLETQMNVQFDIQKEMDFMEMLSYGYI
ncbi:transcription factor MYB117-like [Salvia hispanica]|uniref:transcription factor MYB117-like n=1 Tax=Salvia hispanica TaxID=49212 RepID=UPI0020093A6A|nr:transcription factor MYB117-like [Salvia hispanica]